MADKLEIILASTSQVKFDNIKNIFLKYGFLIHIDLKPLPDKGNPPEEIGLSLEENAIVKARYHAKRLNKICLADDSGSWLWGLNGEPGIYPRRWSESSNELFPDKVLRLLEGNPDRSCTIKAGIAIAFPDGKYLSGSGRIDGTIATTNHLPGSECPRGIFIPEGADTVWCKMPLSAESLIWNNARGEPLHDTLGDLARLLQLDFAYKA